MLPAATPGAAQKALGCPIPIRAASLSLILPRFSDAQLVAAAA
jgi:hypothetical protein